MSNVESRSGWSRRGVLRLGAGLLAAPALIAARPARAELAAYVGEMLVVGFPGNDASDASAKALAAHLSAGRAGGVLFLDQNVGSRADLLGLTALFRNAAAPRLPLLAIDHEGGSVQRVSRREGFTRLASARTMATRVPLELAEELYGVAGFELAEAGFTLNLAPVADLYARNNPVIGRFSRAYSADPVVVADFAAAAIRGFRAGGVLSAVKHFPGHGRSRGDSHTRVVDINAIWSEAELEPFAKLVWSGDAQIVMGAHVVHDRFDGVPVTFSPQALIGELRGRLGFRGVVMTDDLDMAGIRNIAGTREALIRSIVAGNDVLLVSNSADYDPDLPANAVEWITAAVAEGRIPAGRIADSATRIRVAKSRLSRRFG